MIHRGSFDPGTIALFRRLAATAYTRRDDLYAAAEQLSDKDLSAICRKLADDLAGHTAHLQQIIAMHGQDPEMGEAITTALGNEIMKFLRSSRGDLGVVSAVQAKEGELREQYDSTIAATHNPEAQAILEEQKRDVDFAERVLRQVSPTAGADSPPNTPTSATWSPGQREPPLQSSR